MTSPPARSSAATSATSPPPSTGIYPASDLREARRHPGRRRELPGSRRRRPSCRFPQLIIDAVSPLTPTKDGDVKVFGSRSTRSSGRSTRSAAVAALGYNEQWPGPTIRVTEGDKVRINFTNNLKETTGVHFHGIEFDDFFMDGMPFVTQMPFIPGEAFTYEFEASRTGR